MEVINLRNMLEDEAQQKKKLEEEIIILRSQLLQLNFEADQVFFMLIEDAVYASVISFSLILLCIGFAVM